MEDNKPTPSMPITSSAPMRDPHEPVMPEGTKAPEPEPEPESVAKESWLDKVKDTILQNAAEGE